MKKDGTVKEGIFDKSTVYNSPSELSNFGVPINANNTKGFIKWFAELERENEDNIPIIKTVSKLGWREGKFIPFSKDSDIVVDIDYKLKKWLEAYSEKGTLEEWIEAIKPFRDNNLFRFIMASSFSAPLLKIIGHRIFIVFNWGNTRAGKSSALKAALSVWGNPNELTLTFNTTQVGIERLAGLYNDLPLGIDEKQINKSQTDIEKIVYMLGNGIGKIRGNKKGGIQKLSTWNTVVLATGEEPISTDSTNGGVQTRCLEIEGSPFEYDEKKASSMYKIIDKYYGTAGPFFINKIIEEYGESEYAELKEKYEEIMKQIEETTNNHISSYISAVSLVTLADIIIGKYIFNEDEEKSFEMANEILENLDKAEDMDRVEICYEMIKSWILANEASFELIYPPNAIEEREEGCWEEKSINKRDRIKTSYGVYIDEIYYIFPHKLKEKIESLGYNFKKMTSEFAKRGYLIFNSANEKGRAYSIQKKYRGKNVRFYAFPLAESVKELTEEERKEKRKDEDAQLYGFKNAKELEDRHKQMQEYIFKESTPLEYIENTESDSLEEIEKDLKRKD